MCKKVKVLLDMDIDSILRDINQLDEKVYVVSGQLQNQEEVKKSLTKFEYIFVADNPGNNEKNGGEYLSNAKTNTSFKKFIEKRLNTKKEKCLILNKSLKKTKQTIDLRGKTANDKSQKLIANLIKAVLDKNKKCFVVLMGWTDYFKTDKKSIYSSFYFKIKQIIDENSKIKDRFLAFGHPTRGQLFTIKEQNAILGKIPDNKKYFLEFFKYCGRIQFIERQPAREVTGILKEYCEDKELK